MCPRSARADRPGGAARLPRTHDPAGAPGHAPDARAHLQGQHARARQARQLVRAAHRGDPQGQSRQAHRVRQDGEDPGSRSADRHALRGLRGAPWDSDLLLPAIDVHRSSWVACPIWSPPMPPSSRTATSSPRSARGVKRVAIPNRSTKRRPQRKRWRRNAGSATLRNGAPAARAASVFSSAATASTAVATKACPGIKRWVGLGVIADNLINIGRTLLTSGPSRIPHFALQMHRSPPTKNANFAPESS